MLLKKCFSFSLNADRAPKLKVDVISSLKSMPFFSIGYPDRERVEVTLLGSPADPKSDSEIDEALFELCPDGITKPCS